MPGLRSLPYPRWAVLLVAAVALRAITFGNPVVHVDEQFYFAAARATWGGAVPYLDVWDRKPVGLFLLYLPAAALGVPLGIWAYQACALASAGATAWLVARLAERAGWVRGALPAALGYLLWLDLLEGEGGQTPVFYNLAVVAAASLVAPRPDDAARPGRRLLEGAGAFALIGCALQVKYSVVFEGAFFGLWWLWRELRLQRDPGLAVFAAIVLAILTASPTLAIWRWYAVHGWAHAFIYANFVSIGQRVPDPVQAQALNLLVVVLVLAPLLWMAALAWRTTTPAEAGAQSAPSSGRAVALRFRFNATGPRPSPGWKAVTKVDEVQERTKRADIGALRRWLFAWCAAAAAGLLAFGSYFDHYALPLLVPLCACAAGFAEHRLARRVLLPLFVLLVLGSQAMLVAKRAARGTPAEFAALARAVGDGRGCLYVYSGPPMLYTATRRCVQTRYRFPSHLTRARERGAIGVDQQAEIARILAAGPEIVVMSQPFRGERPELRVFALRLMTPAYRLRAALPLGSQRIAVYALSRAAPPRRASTSR